MSTTRNAKEPASESRSAYHHGDLRKVLLREARVMLKEAGLDGLSLRNLAVRAGVSHNAPYMHFANKAALLAAVAQDGFNDLSNEILVAMGQGERDWYSRLINGSRTYVRFGVEHPELFQVMFMEHPWDEFPDLRAASRGAIQRLSDLMVEGQDSGHVVAGDHEKQAAVIWSLFHGVAAIMGRRKTGLAPFKGATTDELIDQFMAQMFVGLKPR
jgi:AcrR family transcriptional regulator